jgi:hypothetical protein
MGEIDDVQQAEYDGKPKAERGIKCTVDETEQKLAIKGGGGNAEYFSHRGWFPVLKR